MLFRSRKKLQSDCYRREGKQGEKARSNTMLIQVQGKYRDEPCGEIVCLELSKPIPYRSLGELIFCIDGIARILDLPDKNQDFRTWNGQKEVEEMSFKRLPNDSPGGILYQGVRQVVCLELIGRQHMSLQGRIRGGLNREDVYFRSALELMHLFSQM